MYRPGVKTVLVIRYLASLKLVAVRHRGGLVPRQVRDVGSRSSLFGPHGGITCDRRHKRHCSFESPRAGARGMHVSSSEHDGHGKVSSSPVEPKALAGPDHRVLVQRLEKSGLPRLWFWPSLCQEGRPDVTRRLDLQFT